MRLFFDGRPALGGIDRMTRTLTRELQSRLGVEALTVFNPSSRADHEGFPYRHRGGIRRLAGGVKRVFLDQCLLPHAVVKSGADLFHSPNYLRPRLLSLPTVVNCYDLTLLDHFVTKAPGPLRYYERWCLLQTVYRASHIITPSDTVRLALRRRFSLGENRLTTIYPFLPSFSARESTASHPRVPDGDFFLSVGTIEPRKNLHRLVEAHARLWRRKPVPLYLVGAYGWGQPSLIEKLLQFNGAVRWLGWVDDDTLGALYEQARAVVQFSLEEGFNMPVAEALGRGTPVVVSDIPVHHEVAGECALFVDREDVTGLADSLHDVLGWRGDQRERHAARARRHYAHLVQRSGIDRYLDVYRAVGPNGSRSGPD